MKITKRQLRRIIKEEKARLLREMGPPAGVGDVSGILYDVLIPALRDNGVSGPDVIKTLHAAADLYLADMKELIG